MQLANIFKPPAPSQNDNRINWCGLSASGISLTVSNLAVDINKPIVVITPDIHSANQLAHEIKFFTNGQLPILRFQDWETLPYDHFSPHADLVSNRLLTLSKLLHLTKGIVIAALPTLMHRLLPREYLQAHSFVMKKGDHLELTQLREQLIHAGYRIVDQVYEHSEFALRGAILDIYPMGAPTPFRIELFDDEVETMRSFDPKTQRSIEKINEIELLPGREYPLTKDSITHFRQAWRAKFTGNPMESSLYVNISEGEPAPGIEYYLPLFFEKTANFFDYLPEQAQLIFYGKLPQTGEQFWQEINERYEQLRYDITRPLCEPSEIFLAPNELFSSIKSFQQTQVHQQVLPEKVGYFNFNTEQTPKVLVNSKAKRPLSLLEDFINNYQGRVLFCVESTGRREVLLDLLSTIALKPALYESWNEFINNDSDFAIIVAPLDMGLQITSPNITLITESQLFGAQVQQRRYRRERQLDPNLMIRNLTELDIGAPVVHIDHGVARYLGLQMIKTGDIEGEFLVLEYAGGDKIYVPVSSLHLISRYTGADADHAPLQKLGSKQWDKVKDKVIKRVRDVAAELLDVYSKREATPGFAFTKPNQDFYTFKNAFQFEETPDQSNAIEDVIKDMTTARAMDRLICGDVGFGKTEVAMQAAFLATQSNKQVAILVPTTLLASQHLQNFQDRFADWPIKIAAISRLRTKKENDEIIKGMANGKLDIIIGTHKLLQESIKFHDLGLLVVDEEHRFGVRQKERIKSLRAHVDILTLTATPIPRTLNMALVGTRDLSIIATPPLRRLAIRTFVHEHNESLIREATLREAMRGGQIYFLHNDVATIQAMAEKLQKIVPEARIAFAHGQMRERELERVMLDFYHQKFNLLICTTIIESGIDIQTANTIIINRADRFGLAQLHQLRGRVGRSHHQAYAYLLTPPRKLIGKDAKKRLDAIMHLEDLGAGFMLATHDLEIRGAGELLGEEQSGHIEAIGFSLYMELLEEAVNALKSGKELDKIKTRQHATEIDLGISALIPEQLVFDVHTRLTLYKRLADCTSKDEIQELKAEIIDRFGLLPDPTQNLFQIAHLKVLATKLGIKKIDTGKEYGYINFSEKPDIDPKVIIDLIQKQSDQYKLQGANKLRFNLTAKLAQDRINAVQQLLKKLGKK